MKTKKLTLTLTLAACLVLIPRPAPADAPQGSAHIGKNAAPGAPLALVSPIPCAGGETVLLIQDVVPWFAPANQDPLGANVTELKAQQKSFCIITSDQIGSTDLGSFKDILISSAQTQQFYYNLFPGGVIHPDIAAWVESGGILSANLADIASGPGGGGTWAGFTFVGGVEHVIDLRDDNSIADPSHPVITGILPCPSGNCAAIVDQAQYNDLDGWGYASHGYFINLSSGTVVILTQPDSTGDGLAEPVMVEYRFGSGVVIASLTTTEWRYTAGGFGGLPQNKKLLANEIAYQDSLIIQGRMSGGGHFTGSRGLRVSHGFQLPCRAGEESDSLQVNWKGGRFHLEELTSAACSDDQVINEAPPVAGIDTYRGEGTGRYNGVPGATARWTFTDAGEPGRGDFARIEIWDNVGNLVLSASGFLKGGNHQAHQE